MTNAEKKKSWLVARDRTLPYLSAEGRAFMLSLSPNDAAADWHWLSGTDTVMNGPDEVCLVLLHENHVDAGIYKKLVAESIDMPESWSVSPDEWRLSRV